METLLSNAARRTGSLIAVSPREAFPGLCATLAAPGERSGTASFAIWESLIRL